MADKMRCKTCRHVERCHFIDQKLDPGETACVASNNDGSACICKEWVPVLDENALRHEENLGGTVFVKTQGGRVVRSYNTFGHAPGLKNYLMD